MGMVKARCVGCKKVRRKAERHKTAPDKRWEYVDGRLLCWVCAAATRFKKDPNE
jgi:rubredoxin